MTSEALPFVLAFAVVLGVLAGAVAVVALRVRPLVSQVGEARSERNTFEERERQSAAAAAARERELLERVAKLNADSAGATDLQLRLTAAAEAIEAASVRERQLSTQLAEARAAQAAAVTSHEELKLLRAEADSKFGELAAKIIADAQAGLLQTATEKVKTEGDAARAEAEAKLATISMEMKAKLVELGTAVGGLQLARENDSKTLGERLAALNEQTTALMGAVGDTKVETGRVANLLSHRQNRGAWGEFELRRLIELTGMSEHISFDVQKSGFGEDERGRPDLVVYVSGGGMLPIDAKVPFDAYQAAIEATDETVRAARHLDSISAFRGHIRALVTRKYHATKGCIGWTLAFVPIESMLSSILATEPTILTEALEGRILIVSPMTLFAYLSTIAHGWALANQQENAEQILVTTKELVKRLAPFAQHFDKVGDALRKAVSSYNNAAGSFDRQVGSQARRVAELGGGALFDAPSYDDVEIKRIDMARAAALGPGREEVAEADAMITASKALSIATSLIEDLG